ncbi:hypothetical protein HY311_01625 [Candidatus Nomurabacteria bacterium]|nr:hypothetical protein [Candidatus Nomurabacteria bacterium]
MQLFGVARFMAVVRAIWAPLLAIAFFVALSMWLLPRAKAQTAPVQVIAESAVVPISSCWVKDNVLGLSEKRLERLTKQCDEERTKFWENFKKPPIVVIRRVEKEGKI